MSTDGIIDKSNGIHGGKSYPRVAVKPCNPNVKAQRKLKNRLAQHDYAIKNGDSSKAQRTLQENIPGSQNVRNH